VPAAVRPRLTPARAAVPGAHTLNVQISRNVQVTRNGQVMHLCPVCNGARLAGADVSPRPAVPAALPRTIGEAAERDRRRAHQDDG